MKVFKEISLTDFDFWSGGAYVADQLTAEDLDIIESVLMDSYPEGMDETEINDIFWFDDDFIAECLGYESWEDLIDQRG